MKISKRSRQWQIIFELFKFRDSVAHGKSTVLEEKETVALDDEADKRLSKHPLVDWEKKIADGVFSGEAQTATEFVLRKIDEVRPYQHGQRREQLFVSGFHMSSGSVIKG